MPIRLFVNELSFPIDDCAFEQAAERLDALVAAFRAAKAIDPGNALDASGIDVHAPYLSELVQPTVQDGAEIWGRRGELFPHLGFIPRVEEQLSSLKKGNLLVSVVFDRLLKLDAAIGTWRDTGVEHPPYSYFIRRESSSREKYAWFADEGGVSQLFSLHGDYAPGENRYHFRLEETPIRRAVVGHIGRKLGI